MSDTLRLDNYLARIGRSGEIAPDLATLARLHAAHVDAIPFESFDPLLRRPVPLDLASLQAKLVDSRRGGYCFEQNLLFKAVLDAIGFTVTGLTGRVRWMSRPDSPLGPREHMMLKVDLAQGAYLADVGFGACLLDAPLQFRTDLEQRTAMGTFRLSQSDGLLSLSARQPAGWRTMYVFDLQPQIQADYELGNWYTSTSPLVPFPSMLIMERLGRDKRYKLINRTFLVEARDGVFLGERPIASAEELRQIVAETFGVTLPAPADEIFRRIAG
ncbi:MAG: arylamine N-acetyltransferase [Alphaproteobacteria bacterium]|nr:arylamine N-acetyltransferase [Alphaproteobacteria bacterium]